MATKHVRFEPDQPPVRCRIGRTEDGFFCETARQADVGGVAAIEGAYGAGATEDEAIKDWLRDATRRSHA